MQSTVIKEETCISVTEKPTKKKAVVFRNFSGSLTLKEYIENLTKAHCC